LPYKQEVEEYPAQHSSAPDRPGWRCHQADGADSGGVSGLTNGMRVADLITYLISWGFRMPTMQEPRRAELHPFVAKLASMRYRTIRDIDGNPEFDGRARFD
jgi:hypothetical protein